MYLGSPSIHPSIRPAISFLGFILDFEQRTVVKRSPFFQPLAACMRSFSVFSPSSLCLSVGCLLACLGFLHWDLLAGGFGTHPIACKVRQGNAIMGHGQQVVASPGPHRLLHALPFLACIRGTV